MVELKASIQQYLSAAQRISLCADIWSKNSKGLTSSYMGITAHFFSRKDHCRHCVTLAVTRFPHPHTGQHVREVVEEVLGEWEIPVSKVTAILTDNGSNMLKAFSTQIVQNEARDDEEDNVLDHDEVEVDQGDEEEFVSKEIEHDVTFFWIHYAGELLCSLPPIGSQQVQ